MSKKTVVLGASPDPTRYSFVAVTKLSENGHEVVPVGIRPGIIHEIKIKTNSPEERDVDTVTLYVGKEHQPALYDYIFSLQPKRIIFNPGTENPELKRMAEAQGIETIQACTLVMLSIGNY